LVIRYRATLAYDGSAYQGFQRQAAGIASVQGAVEDALASISGRQVVVVGAGRTDAGVHASGQVISFDLDWAHGTATLLKALNAVLPDDVALQDIREHPGFHPRYDAFSRRYTYQVALAAQRQPLLRGRAWCFRGVLDGAALDAATALLIGRHDFGAFGQPPTGDSTVREVYEAFWRSETASFGMLWRFTVEANAFLKHMVRRMVWMLVKVGRGQLTVEEFEVIFRGAKLTPNSPIAPPQGLTLEAVRYPDYNDGDNAGESRPPEE